MGMEKTGRGVDGYFTWEMQKLEANPAVYGTFPGQFKGNRDWIMWELPGGEWQIQQKIKFRMDPCNNLGELFFFFSCKTEMPQEPGKLRAWIYPFYLISESVGLFFTLLVTEFELTHPRMKMAGQTVTKPPWVTSSILTRAQ